MTARAKEMIADALSMDRNAVDETTGLSVTPQWDSLAHFRLVLAIEEFLGRKLDPMEIVTLTSFASVSDLVGD